jgi:hypothetical protein
MKWILLVCFDRSSGFLRVVALAQPAKPGTDTCLALSKEEPKMNVIGLLLGLLGFCFAPPDPC